MISAPVGLAIATSLSDPGSEKESNSTNKEISKISVPASVVSSSAPDHTGLECTEDLAQLLDEVNGRTTHLEVIPIVGMKGVGKTTLAQQLYNHPLIVSHYDLRAWITISREFVMRTALLAFLDCLGLLTDEICKQNEFELGECVNKILHSKKYLIVIDDVWDKETWIKLRIFFPNDDTGSRILLTTRKPEVAGYSVFWRQYNVRFMDDKASWKLFCWKVFGQASCPPELETYGKRIAKRCHGLPLAIISTASLLSDSKEKLQYWEQDASSMEVHLDSESLLASYNNLPSHLRLCFLYVGMFPDDYEINVSKIIKLWIAEGFVQREKEYNILEDTMEEYLKTLIDANLLVICQKEFDGKIRTLKIPFLFREFCKKKAKEEKFLCYKNLEDHDSLQDDLLCCVSVQPVVRPSKDLKLTPHLRSFFYIGHPTQCLAPLFLGLTLLRVLDVFKMEFFHFPKEILECVNLRYLAFSCHSDLPSSMSILRNLQFLVIRRLPSFRAFSLPANLWELTQLRHIKCKETCIWHYSENGNITYHTNLQTLSTIEVSKVTHKLLNFTPNLRKLGLFCNESVDSYINLGDLHKLEKLKCFSNLSRATHKFLSYLKLPDSLRKLNLRFCMIPCEFMSVVGSLHILQQLKLQKCTFLGIESMPRELVSEPENLEDEATAPTWELKKDQFSQLISLQMEDLNLVHWKAYQPCLPMLKHLIIRGCSSMREMPVNIGEKSSLRLIKVDEYCSRPVIAAAKEIQKVQLDKGNYILQLHIGGRQGIDSSREYEELTSLNEPEVEKKRGMEAKRKNYMKKLKGRMK